MRNIFILSFGNILVCSNFAFADAVTQPQIEVTASRVSVTVDADLASVSVITRHDIEASGAQDVMDLLRLQPGIDVVRSGGAGQQNAVFLRGTNSNHVLVLIDGVRVASANSGTYAFEQLPLDAVDRIEIVRGPRASYWGSDALGGVIQIFTRQLAGPHVAASYGSYRSAAGSVGYGAGSDAGNFSMQLGERHVGGFSSQNPDGFSYNPDDDGYQNHNVAAHGAWRMGEQTLSGSLLRSQGTIAFDQGYTRMVEESAGVALEGAITTDWQQTLTVGGARENIDTPAFFNRYQTRRESLGWQNSVALSSTQQLTLGFDYLHEHGETRDTYSDTALYQAQHNDTAVYGGWRGSFNALDAELAGRYDHNQTFGNAVSGSAAIGWQFTDAARLVLSYGNGFRGPNLNEQYSPGYGGLFAGNPDLEPERSHSLEAGVDYRINDSNRVSARGFSTRVSNLISFTGGATFRAENIASAAIDGLELEHRLNMTDWSLVSNFTLQNPRNQATGDELLRRPRQKASSVLERSLSERTRLGLELIWTGHREDFSTTLPAYTLLNLRASHTLNSAWRLSARLENLLDRHYELIHGYNTLGRSAYLELNWEPK